MSLFPTIARELRSASRQSFTWHLRVAGAGAVLLACFAVSSAHGAGPNDGGFIFAQLHLALFCAIWIFVPLLTADCISRERREGTLGLLFLTPLSPTTVVAAKALAHGLRAATLGLAALPVLTIPFLLGGVSWAEGVLSVLVNASAIALALSAGLLATSLGRAWTRVAVVAGLLSIGLCCAFCLLCPVLLSVAGFGTAWTILAGRPMVVPWFFFVTDWFGSWGQWFGSLRSGASASVLWRMAGLMFLSFLWLACAVRLCAWRVRSVWREEPLSARVAWIEDQFCRPRFFRRLYRRYMAWRMNRNPVGWLEERTWSARIIGWIWLGIVMFLYCGLLTDANLLRDITGFQLVLAAMLAGMVAASAAGSFRRERESGVLELLLVSPLKEREIVAGRLRGLRRQFYVAAGALVLLWLYLASILPDQRSWGLAPLVFFACAFLVLPVIGLYFSLSCRTFFGAWFSSLAAGLLLPVLLPGILNWGWLVWVFGWRGYGWTMLPGVQSAFWVLAVAALCRLRLMRRLEDRSFPLARWG